MSTRLIQARRETIKKLAKALSYSPEFRKPAQIDFYIAHIDYLTQRIEGKQAEPPRPDHANWNEIKCAIDARVQQCS